jgi:hypothetical protein
VRAEQVCPVRTTTIARSCHRWCAHLPNVGPLTLSRATIIFLASVPVRSVLARRRPPAVRPLLAARARRGHPAMGRARLRFQFPDRRKLMTARPRSSAPDRSRTHAPLRRQPARPRHRRDESIASWTPSRHPRDPAPSPTGSPPARPHDLPASEPGARIHDLRFSSFAKAEIVH